MLRAGPLAATRVTVQPAQRASLAPALFGIGTVRGAPRLPHRPHRRRARAARDGGRRRHGAGRPVAGRDGPGGPRRAAGRAGRRRSPVPAVRPPRREAQRQDALARKELAQPSTRAVMPTWPSQNFISAGALEARLQEQTSADAGRGGRRRPTWPRHARTGMRLAAERDGAAPAARQRCACWRRPRRGHPAATPSRAPPWWPARRWSSSSTRPRCG